MSNTCSSIEFYQIDYFQILLVRPLCHENLLCDEVGLIRWVSLKKKRKLILRTSRPKLRLHVRSHRPRNFNSNFGGKMTKRMDVFLHHSNKSLLVAVVKSKQNKTFVESRGKSLAANNLKWNNMI